MGSVERVLVCRKKGCLQGDVVDSWSGVLSLVKAERLIGQHDLQVEFEDEIIEGTERCPSWFETVETLNFPCIHQSTFTGLYNAYLTQRSRSAGLRRFILFLHQSIGRRWFIAIVIVPSPGLNGDLVFVEASPGSKPLMVCQSGMSWSCVYYAQWIDIALDTEKNYGNCGSCGLKASRRWMES